MQIPFSMNRLIETELRYPQRFSNMVNKSYGLVFFNEGNKASHESNHAVITDYIEVESSIRDVEDFYKGKGINPRFSHALRANDLEIMSPALAKHGYQIEIKTATIFCSIMKAHCNTMTCCISNA